MAFLEIELEKPVCSGAVCSCCCPLYLSSVFVCYADDLFSIFLQRAQLVSFTLKFTRSGLTLQNRTGTKCVINKSCTVSLTPTDRHQCDWQLQQQPSYLLNPSFDFYFPEQDHELYLHSCTEDKPNTKIIQKPWNPLQCWRLSPWGVWPA